MRQRSGAVLIVAAAHFGIGFGGEASARFIHAGVANRRQGAENADLERRPRRLVDDVAKRHRPCAGAGTDVRQPPCRVGRDRSRQRHRRSNDTAARDGIGDKRFEIARHAIDVRQGEPIFDAALAQHGSHWLIDYRSRGGRSHLCIGRRTARKRHHERRRPVSPMFTHNTPQHDSFCLQ